MGCFFVVAFFILFSEFFYQGYYKKLLWFLRNTKIWFKMGQISNKKKLFRAKKNPFLKTLRSSCNKARVVGWSFKCVLSTLYFKEITKKARRGNPVDETHSLVTSPLIMIHTHHRSCSTTTFRSFAHSGKISLNKLPSVKLFLLEETF